MKSFAILASVAAVLPFVSAHYQFPALIVGGTATPAYQYVRANTNRNSPVESVASLDMRCNVGGLASGATTQTHTVASGSTIGFTTDIPIGHPGPTNVYMAKAPSTAAAFDGSGAVWFKIHEIGAIVNGVDQIKFPSDGLSKVTFTIPASVPAGEYLVRIEHVGLHGASSFGGAQFYISCAQVKVTGGGNGKPGPLVSIPGVYTGREPGLLLSIYWPPATTWVQPGPAVWRG